MTESLNKGPVNDDPALQWKIYYPFSSYIQVHWSKENLLVIRWQTWADHQGRMDRSIPRNEGSHRDTVSRQLLARADGRIGAGKRKREIMSSRRRVEGSSNNLNMTSGFNGGDVDGVDDRR